MSRFKETAKTILIFFLIISALFLTLLTWIYDTSVIPSPLYKAAANFLSEIGIDVPAARLVRPETNPAVGLKAAAKPIRCAVTFPNGRYGAEYGREAVDMVLRKTMSLVGEGIGSALTPSEVTRDQWHSALLDPGIYYEYLGNTPLSAIALWQNYEPPAYLSAKTRKIVLAVENEGVAIYYLDAENGKYYRSMTAVHKTEVADQIKNYEGNSNCTFGFEKDSQYPDSMDELFIFDERPVIHAAAVETQTAETPEDRDSAFNSLLKAFGLSPGTKRIVQEKDNAVFAVDGSISMTLSGSGVAEYRNSGQDMESGEAISFSQDGSGEADLIEKVRSIAVSAAGDFGSRAELYLKNIDYYKTSRKYTLSFSYVLNGVPVSLSDSADAASFRIEDGVLTYARIILRKFTLEDAPSDPQPMPAETAAALAGRTEEFGLFYKEKKGGGGPEELTVGWFRKADAAGKGAR